jgi:hypothetical protein
MILASAAPSRLPWARRPCTKCPSPEYRYESIRAAITSPNYLEQPGRGSRAGASLIQNLGTGMKVIDSYDLQNWMICR